MSFSAKERRGLILLGIITLIVISIGLFVRMRNAKGDYEFSEEPYYKSVEKAGYSDTIGTTIFETEPDTFVHAGKKKSAAKKKKTLKKKKEAIRDPYRDHLLDTIK